MTTPIQDAERVRADPVGFVWTLLLALALVAVIGLIAYLVVEGDPIPAPVQRAVAADLPAAQSPSAPAPVLQAPPSPDPKAADLSR